MANAAIVWRRLDCPGHEAAWLFREQDQQRLVGAAVFVHEAQPCRLDYEVLCDAAWRTVSGRVSGWLGQQAIHVELVVDPIRGWLLNGITVPALAGCVDLDLNFSPSTNLLPVRRLNLDVGQQAEIRAAWLRFPSFRLEPLDQLYSRIDHSTYRYTSGGGRFLADLLVNEAGFATHYPSFCQAETAI